MTARGWGIFRSKLVSIKVLLPIPSLNFPTSDYGKTVS